MYHKKEGWRTCSNCACAPTCKQIIYNCYTHEIKECPEKCKYHIYNADPNRYGDIEEILKPLYEWIGKHYPNDTKFLISKNDAELLVGHRNFFNDKLFKGDKND